MASPAPISFGLPLLVTAWLFTVGSLGMVTACGPAQDGTDKLVVTNEPLGTAGYFSVVAAGLVAVVRYGCGQRRQFCFRVIAVLALVPSVATAALGVPWGWLGIVPAALCLAASARSPDPVLADSPAR